MSGSTHQDSCIILNPKSVKGKGRPVQKRKESAVEQPKYKKKSKITPVPTVFLWRHYPLMVV